MSRRSSSRPCGQLFQGDLHSDAWGPLAGGEPSGAAGALPWSEGLESARVEGARPDMSRWRWKRPFLQEKLCGTFLFAVHPQGLRDGSGEHSFGLESNRRQTRFSRKPPPHLGWGLQKPTARQRPPEHVHDVA